LVLQRPTLLLAPSARLLPLRLFLRQGMWLACLLLLRCGCLRLRNCQQCVLELLQTRPCCLQLLLWRAGAGLLFPPFWVLLLWEAWVEAVRAVPCWCCLLLLLLLLLLP
jgi:hypothetical protein